jgi:benzoate transport
MSPSLGPRTMSDIRQLVSSGRMSAHQITAILVCVGLNMLDGFDVLVMSFTAPGVSADWKLSGSQVGMLISAGLVGMALGSLFLAPRADRYGRRAIVMMSVLIVSVGMLLSAVAQSSWQLAALRALTGVGIGGILASATVLVNEYSSSKWRNTASYLYTSGYSIGGTLGGFIAAGLIAKSGWRSAFEFGGIVSFAMLPISCWFLPESLDFLITRQPAGALSKLNRLLTGMHRPNVEALPARETSQGSPARPSLRQLLSPELVRSTLLIWTAFFFMMGGYYFVFGWTPKLLASNGLTAQQGITSGVLLSLGGIFGTVIFAFVARVLEPRWLITFCLLVTCALMGVFASTSHDVSIGLLVGVGLGGMSTTAMAGFYALTPPLYGPHLRTTGMGWGIGIGRIGAILAPMATGLLVDRGWHAVELYWLFAATFLIAALALIAMVPLPRPNLVPHEIGHSES